MKILISTDIEGVAGVFHPQQTRAGNPEYERARLPMTREANAAVAGAFDAGATEVLVNDSHGDFRNMPPDLLDPRAQQVMGKPRYLNMMAGVDQGVHAVCMIGYHSRAQGRGILAHTINSFAFARVLFNECELGEAGIYGALAGEYGVPVVMCSGDNVFIEEHRPLLPHAIFVQWSAWPGTSWCSARPRSRPRCARSIACRRYRRSCGSPRALGALLACAPAQFVP
jgi:D-amino peptidase